MILLTLGYILPLIITVISIVSLILVAIDRISQGILLIAAPMFMFGLFMLAIVYVIRRNNKKEDRNGK